jgi:hypothetical protein
MRIRGVTYRYDKDGVQVEEVCTCHCHWPGARIIHFRACCGVPRTAEGLALLEDYNDELLVEKDSK